MRTAIVRFVRLIKRDKTWSPDSEMTLTSLLSMLGDGFWKAVRGALCRMGLRRSQGLLFVGRHVRLRNKRYISVGRAVVIEDFAEIQGLSSGGITLGDHVTIGSFAMIRPTGYYSGHIGDSLIVGDRSTIGPFGYLGCSGHITIGRNVMIGPRVSSYAENHGYADLSIPMRRQTVAREPRVVEDDCWIASHSVILAGVTIGKGALVAAGSGPHTPFHRMRSSQARLPASSNHGYLDAAFHRMRVGPRHPHTPHPRWGLWRSLTCVRSDIRALSGLLERGSTSGMRPNPVDPGEIAVTHKSLVQSA